MSYNYLVDHAAKNAWCSPDQDKQCIIQPLRISKEEGVWNQVKVLMKYFQLPNNTDRFHVYQIGQVFPIILGLLPVRLEWVNFATCCEQEKMSLDVYNDQGVRYPNHLIWYRYTENRCLIIAIAEHKTMSIDLPHENIYIRLYSNSYFQSDRSNQILDIVKNEGITISDMNSVMNFQYRIASFASQPGKTMCFVNGYLVNDINLMSAKTGDVVEFFHDGSVKKIIDLRIGDLETFNSIRDMRRKYLVHYPADGEHIIDYFDDIDFYLYQKGAGINFQGVLYHRNQGDAIRMITHRDYSIQVPYVVSLAGSIPNNTDPEELILRLYIRNSGYYRPLIQEHNRLHELYKLSDTDVVRAMIGIDSTVPNWKADMLEMSDYSNVMSHLGRDIPGSMVENAYGYNAISKIIGDTPSYTEPADNSITSSLMTVNMPYVLQTNSSVFEYGPDGNLVAWNNHDIGEVYPCISNQARLAEILVGHSGFDLDDNYGLEVLIDSNVNYRCYVSEIKNGVKQNKWQDVTGSSMYAVVNGVVKWLIDQTQYETIVRTDKKILCYDIAILPEDGLLRFPIMQVKTIDGIEAARPVQVPVGELDIFVNGKPIINSLDYIVEWPYVTIRHKEYLNYPDQMEQLITIRAKGFCNADLELNRDVDYGFVMFGMLSMNNRFDIRDDKVLRIVVDGKLKHRDELEFSEEHSGVYVGDVPDGRPYMVRDIVVPTRGMTLTDTYALRESSLEVDEIVGNSMTLKHPMPTRSDVFTIAERYQIYSPYCAKILFDLKNKVLDDPRLYAHYGESLVRELTKPYEYLLKTDPCADLHYPDTRFIDIHPHHLYTVVDVSPYVYKFISAVVKVILKNRVNLSHFVRVSV